MLEIIGLAIGGFIGYIVADFLKALDPLRQTIRQSLGMAREKLLGLAGSHSNNPLIPIGVLILVVILAFWLLGFSSAMLLGVVLGIIFQEEVGRLPFVSGVADNIRTKISGKISGPK